MLSAAQRILVGSESPSNRRDGTSCHFNSESRSPSVRAAQECWNRLQNSCLERPRTSDLLDRLTGPFDNRARPEHSAKQSVPFLTGLRTRFGPGFRRGNRMAQSLFPCRSKHFVEAPERTAPEASLMSKVSVVVMGYLLIVLAYSPAQARISRFQHIIVVVQENRTPDDLFQGLCLPPYGTPSACGSGSGQFDIQSYGFDISGNKVALAPIPLGHGTTRLTITRRLRRCATQIERRTIHALGTRNFRRQVVPRIARSSMRIRRRSRPSIHICSWRKSLGGRIACSRQTRDRARRHTSFCLQEPRLQARQMTLLRCLCRKITA